MLVPRKNNYDLLDDIFDDEFFNFKPIKNEVLKTDIKEFDNHYELITDLPGYKKENIKLSVENGYLTINAKTNKEEDSSEKGGKIIRKERFMGELKRNFYVGDEINESDIKASFNEGILNISIPKKEKVNNNQKKYIEIE
jgi:HSP20 family molecular chaperone IbpA